MSPVSFLNFTRIINKNNIIIKYSNYNKDIALANYNIDIGRIHYFHVNNEFRNKGIGSHMIKNIIYEMDVEHVKKIIYKPSSNYYNNYYFWNKNNFKIDDLGFFYYKL